MSPVDWRLWHDGYSDPDSAVSARLPVVQARIRDFLTSRPDDELQVLSLCAGKGLDLLGALSKHRGANRVKARLVELDPDLAAAARTRAAQDGLDRVEVIAGDASITDSFAGAVPADLVLACGVFGNLSDEDVERTVKAMPQLCARHGVVIWTRHTWSPDLNPRIRQWFSEAGFKELTFDSPGPDAYAVGMNELQASPRPLPRATRLFTFNAAARRSPLHF